MADLVVHYLDLVDALKPGRKPHHMGFSMGGWMAAELAAVAREKFDRIVSVAPAGIAHHDHPPADLSALAPQDFPLLSRPRRACGAALLPRSPCRAVLTDIRIGSAARDRGGREVVAPLGFGHPNLLRWLPHITNPALVVWGA